MGIDVLGIDILGIDILGIDILAPTPFGYPQNMKCIMKYNIETVLNLKLAYIIDQLVIDVYLAIMDSRQIKNM